MNPFRDYELSFFVPNLPRSVAMAAKFLCVKKISNLIYFYKYFISIYFTFLLTTIVNNNKNA